MCTINFSIIYNLCKIVMWKSNQILETVVKFYVNIIKKWPTKISVHSNDSEMNLVFKGGPNLIFAQKNLKCMVKSFIQKTPSRHKLRFTIYKMA